MRSVMQPTAAPGPSRRWGLAVLACTLVVATAAGPARAADKIEDNLPAQAFKVMRYLKKQGYKNVGVLKFRVQKGDKKPSFRVGPLNVAMATRLENVLLLMNDKDKPLGIIHDASQVAARKREKATYTSAQGCDKLFRYKYPLAWGSSLVTADAFVTGIVKINPVKRTTTVTIEAVDRTTKKLTPVTSFVVRTDRSILTDVCTNFALSSKKIRSMALDDQDKDANDNNPTTDKGQPKDSLVDLEILYDAAAQETRQSRKDPKALEVDEPKENGTVVLRLKNKSDKRVAVRLEVNGLNTLYKEEAKGLDELGGRKWVLDPNETWDVKGFHIDDKNYEKFKVLSDEESQKEDLSTNEFIGSIRMLVYVEGGAGGGGDGKITTQGLRKKLPLARAKPRTAREVASLVRKQKGSIKSMGLIKSGDSASADLKTVEFKDPKHAETRMIWYFNPMRQGGPGS
jgi:hypothetical protein